MTSITEIVDPEHPAPLLRSASHPKPKGILKNSHQSPAQSLPPAHSLQWDEDNIALTEIQKDSLMKITEPKTPYVRYNAETDEVEGDIPNLELNHGGSFISEPLPVVDSTPSESSRRNSTSSGRDSSGSRSTSRSTSFSLPPEAHGEIRESLQGAHGEIEIDDEEMDEETAVKHAAFVRARGRHYSNEAEAMKRAVELMDEEDNEEQGEQARPVPPVPPLPNGIHRS